MIEEIENEAMLDAGLVAAPQNVDRCEIAAYGSLCRIGKQSATAGVKLLKEALRRRAINLKLTGLSAKTDVKAKSV